MTQFGTPDWSVLHDADITVYNQAIGASPTVLQYDCARWGYALIEIAGAIGAGGDVFVAATWQDVNGVAVTSNALGNISCPQSTGKLSTFLRHLGPNVTYTITSGGGGLGTVRITHTNRPPLLRTPCTPNMGGKLLCATGAALGVFGTATTAVRGTGGIATTEGQIYTGRAVMHFEGSGGYPCGAYVTNRAGTIIFAKSLVPAIANQVILWDNFEIWVPPEQWSVTIVNGNTAQTVSARVTAA